MLNQERPTPTIPPIQPATIERMTLFRLVRVITAEGESFTPIMIATIAKMAPTSPPYISPLLPAFLPVLNPPYAMARRLPESARVPKEAMSDEV